MIDLKATLKKVAFFRISGINFKNLLVMRLFLICYLLFSQSTVFSNHLYYEMIDFTPDGELMAGISTSEIGIIDTKTKRIVAKLPFESISRLVNIRISNNGKKLLWTRNMKLYSADFIDNEILNIYQIPVQQPWLDLEINADGSKIITTSDNTSAAKCSPKQRSLYLLKNDGNPYSYRPLQISDEDCTYLNYCEFLPNGNILFQFQNNNMNYQHQNHLSIWEARYNEKSKVFDYIKILASNRMIARQAVSDKGELLTYDEEYFISKKDSLGNWQTKSIFPKNDYPYANWVCAISPDGEKIVFLKNIMKNNQTVASHFMISKKINNEWTTPQTLVEENNPTFDNVLANIRLSNTNFAYTDRNGRVMLKMSLEANADLVELVKEK